MRFVLSGAEAFWRGTSLSEIEEHLHADPRISNIKLVAGKNPTDGYLLRLEYRTVNMHQIASLQSLSTNAGPCYLLSCHNSYSISSGIAGTKLGGLN